MSYKTIKRSIENFITDDSNNALALKGAYGVGKTYFWNELIRAASRVEKPYYEGVTDGEGRGRKIGKPFYAYVSLFGIDGLESLKNTLFSELEPSTNIGGFSNRADKGSKWFGTKLLTIPHIEKLSGSLLSSLAFQTVENALICFDDLDRMGNKLNLTEVIGLANLLKERHNCKIAIILNEEQLAGEAEEYRKQVEKLIDFEIQFSLQTDEILEYVFASTFFHVEFIKQLCRQAEIKNIRILQKVRTYVEQLRPHIVKFEDSVIKEVLRSLVLYVYCHYNREGNTPPLEVVEKFDATSYITRKEQESNSSQKDKEWYEFFKRYDYRITREIDHLLLSFVRNGYLDDKTLKTKLEARNEEIIKQRGVNSFREAWKLYNGSFKCNEDEFIAALTSGFRANIHHLNIRQLRETVTRLRQLKNDAEADALVDDFVDKRFDGESRELMRRGHIDYQVEDTYLAQRLNEKLRESQSQRDLKTVLRGFGSPDSYLFEDVDFLTSVTSDEFYDYFKSCESEGSTEFYLNELRHQVKKVLDFAGSGDEPYRSIGRSARESVLRLALDCNINKLRVMEWFEISEEEIEQERSNRGDSRDIP